MKKVTMLALEVCLLFGIPLAASEKMAPEFHISPPGGTPTSIQAHRGQVVVVQFLFTDCVHCQATARMLTRLQQELGGRGLQVLGVAFNDLAQTDPEQIRQFVANNHVGFPVGAGERSKVLEYLGISVMSRFVVPQILVVGRDGHLSAQSAAMGSPELQDENHLRDLLSRLLNQPAARLASTASR
jgi:peroxiredoxin